MTENNAFSRFRAACEDVGRSWWPVLIIAFLVGGMLYQRWQYTHPGLPVLLKAGEHIPAVKLLTLEGHAEAMDWMSGSRPTVLYAFRPDCIWCERNVPSAAIVASRASSLGYRVVGLSLTATGLREYLEREHLQFPVYVAPDAGTVAKLRVKIAPETIVISPAGVVERVWHGAYIGQTEMELESFFHVKLPSIPGS